MKTPLEGRLNGWSPRTSFENTPTAYLGHQASGNHDSIADSLKTAMPSTPCGEPRSHASSPRKINVKKMALSPDSSQRENAIGSPRSVI